MPPNQLHPSGSGYAPRLVNLSSSSLRNSLDTPVSITRTPLLSSRTASSRVSLQDKARPIGVGDRLSSLANANGRNSIGRTVYRPPPRTATSARGPRRDGSSLDHINPLDSSISDVPLLSARRDLTLGNAVTATRERILADTERCERELNEKCREKQALAKVFENLKKRKAMAKARRNKQNQALDTLKSKCGEHERALAKVRHQIKVSGTELASEQKLVRAAEESRDKFRAAALRLNSDREEYEIRLVQEDNKRDESRRQVVDATRQKENLLNEIRQIKGAQKLMEQRVWDLRMQTEALEGILKDALRL